MAKFLSSTNIDFIMLWKIIDLFVEYRKKNVPTSVRQFLVNEEQCRSYRKEILIGHDVLKPSHVLAAGFGNYDSQLCILLDFDKDQKEG